MGEGAVAAWSPLRRLSEWRSRCSLDRNPRGFQSIERLTKFGVAAKLNDRRLECAKSSFE
jgi:hypothetical protein